MSSTISVPPTCSCKTYATIIVMIITPMQVISSWPIIVTFRAVIMTTLISRCWRRWSCLPRVGLSSRWWWQRRRHRCCRTIINMTDLTAFIFVLPSSLFFSFCMTIYQHVPGVTVLVDWAPTVLVRRSIMCISYWSRSILASSVG